MGHKYNQIESSEGLELKDLGNIENHGLLESFNPPLEDDSSVSDADDGRLVSSHSSSPPSTGASEIDRNIHNAIRNEGASSHYDVAVSGEAAPEHTAGSSSNSGGSEPDLENQLPHIRLTRTQRVMNVLQHLVPIKSTYDRISNGLATGRMQPNVPGRFIGQGTDGVFRNLMAKPDTEYNGAKNETNPPTYEEAAADSTPEYWETSVIAPIYEDEVFVEGLPVGNIANFVWNMLVTVAFQFVGFLLCYLLHTSHAAKHGSRAGLGVVFIFYGWNLVPSNFGSADKLPDRYEPKNPNNYNIDKNTAIDDAGVDNYASDLYSHQADETVSTTPYFAYGLIAFGLLVICKALVDYYRVKQMEQVILHPPGSEYQTNTITSTTTNYENENHNDNEIDDNGPTWTQSELSPPS
ncbi:hypothetical protein PSN45_001641 [Yamadazyma tenuis]|uniref:Metal homeostatis protein BSD2 n=1 Tax=Candida tenuis (strain ATCC 10573 / BCRC 21748 / CBS 615 / JCM 9827 / NBRC 10315 / NRRL Y-1498 / VKM Y-70) TaxID=590646 RepID=G3BET7_CANTC|nr:uncharacterized protein CANTEDRAFT_127970 [Yamadazyma tenuis ATCC 10573]EGV60590.1 hypothetical protein CANTEDRAFT_127970 [Yamadazyma tenuis ATCC 10573]WEJ94162.1 hypothetical protein PSN45_001641 [Yamadazyma tenuis]